MPPSIRDTVREAADPDAHLSEIARACTPKQRAFPENYPATGGKGGEAARRAGYSAKTASKIAYIVLRHPSVVAYVGELVKAANRALTPKVVNVLEAILDDPTHKDRARVALTLVEKADPTETRHNVQVTHVVDHDKDAVDALRHMLAIGATRAMLEAHFGFTGLSRYERMLALEDATK